MQFLKDFMSRTPFAILGAIGIISMVSNFIALQEHFRMFITAWQGVTRPIWEYVPSLFDIAVPWYVSDYLTAWIIIFGMIIRSANTKGFLVACQQVSNLFLLKIIFSAIGILLLFWIPLLFVYIYWLHGSRKIFGMRALSKFIFGNSRNAAEYEELVDLFFRAVLFTRKSALVFWEALLLALIFIAVNYSWIYAERTKVIEGFTY